jgi:dihydrofolate reductase
VRTFTLQVQTSVDGYMASPDGGLGWLTLPWSDDMLAYSQALHDPVDLIVLGRNLAEGFIPAWEAGPPGETQEAIDKMNDTPKVVISRSLDASPWGNAVVDGGDLAETIGRLKSQDGGDIIAYGGGTLVRSLIAEGLLDDLHLFVNPAAIGTGMPAFPDTGAPLPLDAVEARRFDCSVTALHLRPKRH